jgi:hypothetical protein
MTLLLSLTLPAVTALAGPAASGAAPQRQQDAIDEGQLQELQGRMLGDPQVMALISALQNDPELQALLKDPAFMQALADRDIATLASDPRFVKLFSNPLIQEIIKRVEP